MKQYKIFMHPSGKSESVKQGWSWPAFFFICFWAMVKKMWGFGVGILISMFVFGLIIGFLDIGDVGNGLINIISLIISIIFGVNGNSWREENLLSRGFEQVDTVTAANPEGALALYLKSANTG
jgi:hypothetical protein